MTSQVTLQVTVDPSGAVSGTGRVTSSVQGMTSSVNNNLNSLQQSFNRLNSFINKATLSITGFFAAAAVTSGLEKLLDRMIEVNTSYVQFTSTLEAVKGSAGLAAEEFDYLFRVANQMGLNVESVEKSYTRLAASMKHVDATGEGTRHVFEGVATAASVLHMKGYEVNGVLLAFEQLLSKNKVSLEEVQRQLSNRLPDAMGLAARSMNMTQSDFRKAITEGSINPLEFVLKMANQIKEEYGTAAKITADSFIGQQARMHNAVEQLYRTVGQSGAMEGLTRVLKAVTGLLDNPDTGKALGSALDNLFSDLAGWISSITASDIEDFFNGLAGVVKSFVIIMRDLTNSFSETVDGKVDFINFAQAITNAMLTVIEVVHTLVNAIMTIPAAFKYANAAYEVFGRVTSPKAISFTKSGAEKSEYAKGTEEAVKRMDDAQKAFETYANKAAVDGLLNKARTDVNKVFDDMKAQRDMKNRSQSFPLTGRKVDTSPLSEAKINELKKQNPDPVKKEKAGRDVFNSESVSLAKAAATSMLEYNNAMNDVMSVENKHLTQLEIKFRYDKEFIKLSSGKKDILRQLAREADIAAAKEVSAKAYQEDKLALNKALYEGEQDMIDVLQYRNVTETKNQRAFEEKLKFDVKYRMFTEEMIKVERDKAKAVDDQAVKIENLKKVEESRFATRVLQLQVERDMANMSKGFGPNKYNEANNVTDTMRKGGANFNLEPESKLKMIEDARNRDRAAMERDAHNMGFNVEEQTRQWDFERSMIGKTTLEIQKFTEQKKILDFFRLNGIDLSKEENEELRKYADFLQNHVYGAIEKVRKQQEDWRMGVKSGMAQYMDEISNVAKNMEQVTVKVFKGMEDSLVDFVMTGKFNFADFATMVIKELVRIMIQMTIMKPLMQMLSGTFGGEAGMFGFDLFASANGNVFNAGSPVKFAKGGAFTNSVVSRPTNFMMGQMGEAGPEAVMPLTRDGSGRLGVRAQGGGGGVGSISISVQVINGQNGPEGKVTTSEDGNDLAEKIKAVTLGVIHDELRQGGSLARVRS